MRSPSPPHFKCNWQNGSLQLIELIYSKIHFDVNNGETNVVTRLRYNELSMVHERRLTLLLTTIKCFFFPLERLVISLLSMCGWRIQYRLNAIFFPTKCLLNLVHLINGRFDGVQTNSASFWLNPLIFCLSGGIRNSQFLLNDNPI